MTNIHALGAINIAASLLLLACDDKPAEEANEARTQQTQQAARSGADTTHAEPGAQPAEGTKASTDLEAAQGEEIDGEVEFEETWAKTLDKRSSRQVTRAIQLPAA